MTVAQLFKVLLMLPKQTVNIQVPERGKPRYLGTPVLPAVTFTRVKMCSSFFPNGRNTPTRARIKMKLWLKTVRR